MDNILTKGLESTGFWGEFRRWLGFYTKDEREVIAYSKKLKRYAFGIRDGKERLTRRPEWMRHEDYREMRKLQQRFEKRRRR